MGKPPYFLYLKERLRPQHDKIATEAIDNTYAFADAFAMISLSVTQARARLYELLDKTVESHEPIHITGKRASAVLVSEDDWRSIQETLHLLSIPGMRESIRSGMAESLKKSSTKPGW